MITIILNPDFLKDEEDIEKVQRALFKEGFDPKGFDGITGRNTRAAWQAWFVERTAYLNKRDPAQLALYLALNDACNSVKRGTRRAEELVISGGGKSTKSAWCAYGAAGWYKEACKDLDLTLVTKTTGGVVRWWHSLDDSERISVADVKSGKVLLEPGMMFFRTRVLETVAQAVAGGTPYGHMGLVEKYIPVQPVWTGEANTNDTDSAVGGRVVAKATLDINDPRLLGFGRIRTRPKSR
jgi:hypothetical protein